MAGNPLSGHTKANMTLSGSAQPADGLTDGDHILSPTLTNFLEGIHGNGILLEEDTAYGDGDRDDPENLPGACNQQTNSYTFRVQGGLAVLDGVLYAFADGPGNSTDIVISSTSTSKTGSPTALTSGQEALVVVYLSADDNAKHVYWEMGTAVTTASNTYPTTPSAFLNAPGSLTNRNTTVLATLRVVYSATGGDYNVSISEINDKRAFVRPSPIYFSPVTSGAVAATTAATNPDAFHSGDEAGSLAGSRVGALWQSYNADGDSLLYYSAKTDSSTRHTHVLGPSSVKALTPSATTTFTYDESSIFVITPTSAHQFNPSGTFPKGHMVFVSNHAAHGTNGITFDNGGLGSVILGKESALFVYDGTNWKSVIFASGATSPNGHGANGAIQLSDGGGGFTSDTNLTWTASPATLTVNGKLDVSGLIDPTGLVIDEKANVAATGHTSVATKGLLWVKDDTPNRLYFTDGAGTDKKVIHATDSVTELSDVTNAGSGAIITTVERTKLSGIETNADVTDETNVKSAIDGMTLTDIGTPVSTDRVLIQDASASNALKYADFSEFGGGGGGDEIADADSDTKIQVEEGTDEDKIRFDTAGSERMIIDDAGNVGIGTSSPGTPLHIVSSIATDMLRLESTDAGNTGAPDIDIYRNSASPADNDEIGMIVFRGKDDAGNKTSYAWMLAEIEDVSNGTEKARINFHVQGSAGTGLEAMRIDKDGIQVAGSVSQSSVTSAVLVANGSGDLVAASNLADQTYLAPGGAQTDTFAPTTSVASWAAPPPATIQDAIDRLAAFVVTIPGAPPQIP